MVRKTFINISIKSYLHLAHYGMIGSVNERIGCGEGVLIDILNLQATLLVEPVLQAADGFMLVHAEVGIEVEEVVRSNKLKLLP